MKGEAITTNYGEIPFDWRVKKLCEVCVPNSGIQTGPFGSQLHQHDYQSTGTPIITVEHLGENRITHQDIPLVSDLDLQRLSRYSMKVGDIIFSRVGSVDRRSLVREEENGWLFSGRCLRVRPDPDVIIPEFLSWFFGLSIFKEHIRAIAVGATMPSINTDILSNVQVILPPLPEQKAIAHILGALDDKIEINRRTNHTLEQMARALFKSWFVDFDPVNAKAEGRVPFGMNAETASLFPSEFEETRLGSVPKGWSIDKVSAICSTQYGYTTSASDQPIGPKFLRITDINKEPWIEWENVPFCEVQEGNKTKYELRIGDILVSRMADPGKAGIVEHDIDAVFASYLVRLKAKNLAWAYFLFYFLRSDFYLDYADGVMSGSVQLGMNAKVIVDADIVLPREEIVNSFLNKVQPLRNKIVSNLNESNTLASIRDALLPKLLSGELRVKL